MESDILWSILNISLMLSIIALTFQQFWYRKIASQENMIYVGNNVCWIHFMLTNFGNFWHLGSCSEFVSFLLKIVMLNSWYLFIWIIPLRLVIFQFPYFSDLYRPMINVVCVISVGSCSPDDVKLLTSITTFLCIFMILFQFIVKLNHTHIVNSQYLNVK